VARRSTSKGQKAVDFSTHWNFLASTGEKAPAGLTVVIAWLWLTVAWSATYWILFFATGVVQTSSDTAYLDFERAFPVADAWLRSHRPGVRSIARAAARRPSCGR
jgi:hypothetical protein